MSGTFRPKSRNLMGGAFWNEFTEWSLKTVQGFDQTMGKKLMQDGAPPGHVKTSDAQQLELLRAARDKGDPMYSSNPQAQQRLAQLESKQVGIPGDRLAGA